MLNWSRLGLPLSVSPPFSASLVPFNFQKREILYSCKSPVFLYPAFSPSQFIWGSTSQKWFKNGVSQSATQTLAGGQAGNKSIKEIQGELKDSHPWKKLLWCIVILVKLFMTNFPDVREPVLQETLCPAIVLLKSLHTWKGGNNVILA